MKHHQSKLIRKAVVLICFLGIVAGVCFWYLEEYANFHPITPGEAYRSAQLDQDQLEYYVRKYQIQSIINLGGKKERYQWYKNEIETSQKLGVRHFDLRLSARKAPSALKISELLRLFEIAPRPVLIHCQAGADRSGLAAAVWKVVIDGSTKSTAQKQLSIRFGHVPFGPSQVMDDFFENWVIPTKPETPVETLTDALQTVP